MSGHQHRNHGETCHCGQHLHCQDKKKTKKVDMSDLLSNQVEQALFGDDLEEEIEIEDADIEAEEDDFSDFNQEESEKDEDLESTWPSSEVEWTFDDEDTTEEEALIAKRAKDLLIDLLAYCCDIAPFPEDLHEIYVDETSQENMELTLARMLYKIVRE